MYYIYITASISRVIYVGMTNSLSDRIKQHKAGEDPKAFTARYNINRLVYYETYKYVYNAIERKKQLKRWSRKKKVTLIESVNPKWKNLSLEPLFDKPSEH